MTKQPQGKFCIGIYVSKIIFGQLILVQSFLVCAIVVPMTELISHKIDIDEYIPGN
jgi:hypothetical protein